MKVELREITSETVRQICELGRGGRPALVRRAERGLDRRGPLHAGGTSLGFRLTGEEGHGELVMSVGVISACAP